MNKGDIFQLIKNNLLELIPELNPNDITVEASMRNLGANSIDRADVIISTLEALSLKVPLTELATLQNLDELAAFLYIKWQTKESTTP